MAEPTQTSLASNVTDPSDSTDPLDVSALAGTWVGAFVAIVALVGIVAPWLAIRAAFSAKNRAFNAVFDADGKYVSRGIRFIAGLRILRRQKVPNLATTYNRNNAEPPPLCTPDDAVLNVSFKYPEDLANFNTGWSKLCEVIAGYEFVSMGANNQIMRRRIPLPATGGPIEIVNSTTALVVSKYWILILGLLGRYTASPEESRLQKATIQRELGGEHTPINDAASDSEMDEPSLYASSTRTATNQGTPGVIRKMYGYIGRFGIWEMRRELLSVYGNTGQFQSLGRMQGSWSFMTALLFVPGGAQHTNRSHGDLGPESASLKNLFWLAYGAIPWQQGPDGSHDVISITNPLVPHINIEPDILVPSPERRQKAMFFRLVPAEFAPISLNKARKVLGLKKSKIHQWTECDRTHGDGTAESVPEKLHDDWIETSPPDFSDLEKEGWHPLQEPYEQVHLWRQDLGNMVSMFLHLQLHTWGYLVQQTKVEIWRDLLAPALDLSRDDLLDFICTFYTGDIIEELDWSDHMTYHPDKIRELVVLEKKISDWISSDSIRLIKVALGVSFILQPRVRVAVRNLLEDLGSQRPEFDGDQAMREARRRQLQENLRAKITDRFYYDFDSGELTLYVIEDQSRDDPYARHTTYFLDKQLVCKPSNVTAPIIVPAEDMVLIALWVKVRVHLWLSFQDSRHLLKFVHELDRHCYIF